MTTKKPADQAAKPKARRNHTPQKRSTKGTYLDESWRDKIQRGVILKRMADNHLGKIQPELTAGQIKCGEILLKKCAADLKQIEHVGNADHPVELVIKWDE